MTQWGWVHLILGVLTILAGGALFTGKLWARIIGVALAFFGIWALTVHGRELAESTSR